MGRRHVWYSVKDDEICENTVSPLRVANDCLKKGTHQTCVLFMVINQQASLQVQMDTGEIFIYLGPL